MKGDWDSINWNEFWGAITMTMFVGLVRFLYLLRKGRKFKLFDLLLEPSLALIAGMSMWGVAEVSTLPDVLQAVMTSLGAWGGPRTIAYLEVKYLGTRR